MRQHTHWRSRLDEVYVRINGEMRYLWRAIDHEGEVLESYVTKERDKAAALTFIKKAPKQHGRPKAIVIDGLRSYRAALSEIGAAERQEVGRWTNNHAENSHLPFRRRERAMARFRRMKTLQMFSSAHAPLHNPSSVAKSISKTLRRAGGVAGGHGLRTARFSAQCARLETSCGWTDTTGHAPDDTLRASQERQAAGRARAASDPRVAGAPANHADQRHPRPLRRVRHDRRAGRPPGERACRAAPPGRDTGASRDGPIRAADDGRPVGGAGRADPRPRPPAPPPPPCRPVSDLQSYA